MTATIYVVSLFGFAQAVFLSRHQAERYRREHFTAFADVVAIDKQEVAA